MCFGNEVTETKNTTGTSLTNSNQNTAQSANTAGTTFGSGTTSATANPAVQDAATQNLAYAQNLQKTGFTPYTGQQVAGFSPDQQASFGLTNSIVGNGTGDAAKSLIGQYSGAPAQNVNANTISSAMSPYMNQYVMQALAPQLRQMELNNAATNRATDANATGSGAFGDARTGIEQSNNAFNQNVAREGLIGNAYNNAFNTAIGAGAQDVSNNLSAQNSNASYMEQMLQRALGGSTALQGLQNQQLGTATALNTAGQQQTAQQQADLTAQYNQWLMAQQYPFQTTQLLNSTVGTAANALPASTNTTNLGAQTGTTAATGNTTGTQTGATTGTAVTEKPDNSGLALLGSLGGAVLGNSGLGSAAGALMFSDARLKEDIAEVGELRDGQKVYSYRYKGSPVPQIGLMAQEVMKRRPDAVGMTKDGLLMVDYSKATEAARILSMAV